jgi:hypothetical protein
VALLDSIKASKNCTINTVQIPDPEATGGFSGAAAYPTVLHAVLQLLLLEYPERPEDWTEEFFESKSKSQRQRWIRKLKNYAACLRVANRIDEYSAINAAGELVRGSPDGLASKVKTSPPPPSANANMAEGDNTAANAPQAAAAGQDSAGAAEAAAAHKAFAEAGKDAGTEDMDAA